MSKFPPKLEAEFDSPTWYSFSFFRPGISPGLFCSFVTSWQKLTTKSLSSPSSLGRGLQYCSKEYTGLIRESEVNISMTQT